MAPAQVRHLHTIHRPAHTFSKQILSVGPPHGAETLLFITTVVVGRYNQSTDLGGNLCL